MAETQGESSDVEQIKQALEEQEKSFLAAAEDLGQYDPSIDATASEAHSAVDGSSKPAVAELFALVDESKAVLGGVAEKAEQYAKGVSDIRERL